MADLERPETANSFSELRDSVAALARRFLGVERHQADIDASLKLAHDRLTALESRGAVAEETPDQSVRLCTRHGFYRPGAGCAWCALEQAPTPPPAAEPVEKWQKWVERGRAFYKHHYERFSEADVNELAAAFKRIDAEARADERDKVLCEVWDALPVRSKP